MNETDHTYDVIIIGAGLCGIAAALELERKGITDFLILEKIHDVGGLWTINTYPGVRCDIPAFYYSYEGRMPKEIVRYPEGDFHRRYLRDIVTEHDLWKKIRLQTTVESLAYDDTKGTWTVTRTGGQTYRARFVIAAIGLLHIPFMPDWPGREQFDGTLMHTSEWDHEVDLTDKRIAVIGTGASAAQLIPELAPLARRLTVFQRTPAWVVPLKGKPEFSPFEKWAFGRWPALKQAYRKLAFHVSDKLLSPLSRGGWSSAPLATLSRVYLRFQVPNPELRRRLTPVYPIGCKRIVVDRNFLASFRRGNVDLITDPIERFTEHGIRTTTGEERAFDVVIAATGFNTSDFMQRIQVRGREGRLWSENDDRTRSFLGMALPGFPAFFTGHGHGSFTFSGSNIAIEEAQARAIVSCIAWCMEYSGSATVELRPEVMERYKRVIDEEYGEMVFDSCQSWFRSRGKGAVINPWIGSTTSFIRATKWKPEEVFFLRRVQ